MAGLLSKGITLGLKKAGMKKYIHTIQFQYDDPYPVILESNNPVPFTDYDFHNNPDVFVGCKIIMFYEISGTDCTIASVKLDRTVGSLKVFCTNGTTHELYGCTGLNEDAVTIASSDGETFTDLSNLQEIAELGNNAPEKIDVTVLSDGVKKSINGLSDTAQELTFKFLYDKAQFNMLAAPVGSYDWRVSLPDGTTATFTATPSVKLAGVGVSAALTYSLILSVESEIVFA